MHIYLIIENQFNMNFFHSKLRTSLFPFPSSLLSSIGILIPKLLTVIDSDLKERMFCQFWLFLSASVQQ